MTSTIEDTFLKAFQPASLNGARDLFPGREEAESLLNTLQLPNRKTEEWKYTSLRPLMKREYRIASSAELSDINAFRIPGLDSDIMVFVNGIYAPHLSDLSRNGDVIEVSPLSQLKEEGRERLQSQMRTVAKSETDIFTALNTAYAKEGIWVQIPEGKAMPAPIHLIHVSVPDQASSLAQCRNVFSVEKNAAGQVVASYHTVGEGHALNNAVTEIKVETNADFELIQFQLESDHTSRIDRVEIHQEADSRCSLYTFTMSGEIVRNNVILNLEGKNTESHLIGAYLLSGEQHVDNYTEVHHKQPHCLSNELYKGIVGDQATGVFSGKIHVYEDAQQTNAYQTNRNIILSDSANIYTKPQLEIYADDVKCSHGATTGRLDEEAMFYLQARGIKEYDARIMLIYAFCMEVAETIRLEPIKEYVSQLIQQRY